MTENEAVKVLEYTKRNCGMPEQGEKWKPNRETIAIDMAIKAIEEIQQYRAIGTVEECREARERQIPEKPEIINGGISVCPVCGAKVLRCYDFCKDCGNAIDWSE